MTPREKFIKRLIECYHTDYYTCCTNSCFKLNDAMTSISTLSNRLKVVNYDCGELYTIFRVPYIILTFRDEVELHYFESTMMVDIDESNLRINIMYPDSIITGIMLRFDDEDLTLKSYNLEYRKWWNSIFKLFNKHYKLKIKMLRVW